MFIDYNLITILGLLVTFQSPVIFHQFGNLSQNLYNTHRPGATVSIYSRSTWI